MTHVSIGDLSSYWSTRLQITQVKEEVNTLTTELATGRKSSVLEEQRGDVSRMAALERSIDITDRYATANADTRTWLDTAQTSLDSVQSSVSRSASQVLSAASGGSLSALQKASVSAANELSAVMSALNVGIGGAALFSGSDTETPPLVESENLLDALSIAIASATSADDALSAIDTWFDDPVSGFASVAYRGHPSQSVQLVSSEEVTLSFDVRANDPALVGTLKAFSIAALARDPVFAGDTEAQTTMLQSAADQLFTAEGHIAQLRGGIGTLQSHAEEGKVMLAASKVGYEITLNDMYKADPYATASRLDEVTLQLEVIYSITARLSELTLARYLR